MNIFERIEKAVLPPRFNPVEHQMPLPIERRQKTVTSEIPNDVFWDDAFQNNVRFTADKNDNSKSWEVVKTTEQADTSKQRVGAITDKDRQQLADRNLGTDIALIVKPYWLKRVGRKEAARMIDQKGIYQSLIGLYYAAFNAAIEEAD